MSEDYEARAHKQLQIESWSNAARTLLIRGAAEGGPFAEQHTTNADRSRATDTFELHGRPIKVQISPSTAPVRRGECYVRATLLLDGEPVQRLSAGYLTDSKTLSWPPGVFEAFTEGPGLTRAVVGTNPAAGAEISETVPTNALWRLKALEFQLVTDATVSTRRMLLTMDDGTSIFTRFIAGAGQTASQTVRYILSTNPVNDAAQLVSALRVSMHSENVLPQGFRIRTVTVNIQVGDDYASPVLIVEEWIEE